MGLSINTTYITINGDVGNDVLRTSNLLTDGTFQGHEFTLNGLEGDDTLIALNGSRNWPVFTVANPTELLVVTTYLYGGAGNDRLFSTVGFRDLGPALSSNYGHSTRMYGGDGDDLYVLRGADVYIREYSNVGSGTDTVLLTTAYATATGGGFFDLSNFDYVENIRVQAGVGNTQLLGNGSNNNIVDNAGNGSISGDLGDDTISGQAGNDTVFGEDGNDVLYGGTGLDQLFGGYGDNTLYGGADNDSLTADDGNDRLYGGLGDDSITSGNGDDYLLGADGNDRLFGGAGNDTLNGGVGDDSLNSGLGDNSLYGGAGNDTLTGNTGRDLLIGGDGDDELRSDHGDDDLRGGIGNDLMYGDAGDDILRGGENNDRLYGEYGNDILYGGAGFDAMYGDDGDDLYSLDSLADRVIEYADQGNDTITSSTISLNDQNYDHIEAMQLGGTANLDLTAYTVTTVIGNDGDNFIIADAAGAVVTANAGEDSIYGASSGSDFAYGGSGNDFITFYYGSGSKTLDGGDGNDNLNGSAGDDYLIGGLGSDYLDGANAGVDTFVFSTADYPVIGDSLEPVSAPIDTIGDFTLGVDKIDISGFGPMFGNLASSMNILLGIHGVSFDLTGGGTIRAESISSSRLVIDVNGDGGADGYIDLAGQTASNLQLSDFLFIQLTA